MLTGNVNLLYKSQYNCGTTLYNHYANRRDCPCLYITLILLIRFAFKVVALCRDGTQTEN